MTSRGKKSTRKGIQVDGNIVGTKEGNMANSANSGNSGTVMESQETETTRTSRGRTRLDKLVRQRAHGIRKDIKFNKFGQPIGDFASEMQSYIGILAQEKVRISYKSWKQVPSGVKDLIWESVNVS